jgi:hypothetical protein
MNELHEAAHHYHREHKLPITLCKAGTKKPFPEAWQKHRWTLRDIDREFRACPNINVGIRLGKMIDIECDRIGGERALHELFDGDVPVAPTWLSRRSPHRLFLAHPDLQQIGKATVRLGPLEIRIGANGKGAQSLLPPSVADGFKRKWQVTLDECDPPALPDRVVHRLLQVKSTKIREKATDPGAEKEANPVHRVHREIASVHSVLSVDQAVAAAIRLTIPSEGGHRHRALFNFARQLKGIPTLSGANLDSLKPYVAHWHMAALPFIDTKDFEESWYDFGNAWSNVQFPAGEEPLQILCGEAMREPLPKCAGNYKADSLRRMVLLCRELQRRAGNEPFYLACRSAGAVLGIDFGLANKWTRLLTRDGVLEVVRRGTLNHASRYRYLGD